MNFGRLYVYVFMYIYIYIYIYLNKPCIHVLCSNFFTFTDCVYHVHYMWNNISFWYVISCSLLPKVLQTQLSIFKLQ